MQIYGLIGYPVKHSFSPLMHNAAFKACGIEASYKLFEITPAKVENFLLKNIEVKDIQGNSYSSRDIIGFNVTIPYKVRVREIVLPRIWHEDLPEQDHYVFISGAVNTVKREKGKLVCCNTDAPGFIKSLSRDLGFAAKDKNVFIAGCGGAGRAVVASLTWKDAGVKKIYIYEINKEAVKSAREYFSQFDFVDNKLEFVLFEQIPEVIKGCQLLVDATGSGLKDEDTCVIDKKFFHKDLFVYDLVYNKETRLIKDARSLGLKAQGGLGMLLYQGALAFEFWTRKSAPLEVMKTALEQAV
ncbi:MAG: shikimate dehydrogenase [Candidatus Omnitrophica bacterium]|nr:shikimate dehydrogenase [Candidatus Omnitrophota bacterium]